MTPNCHCDHTDIDATADRLSELLSWPLRWLVTRRLAGLRQSQLALKSAHLTGQSHRYLTTATAIASVAWLLSLGQPLGAALMAAAVALLLIARSIAERELHSDYLPHLYALTTLSPSAHLYVATLSSQCTTYKRVDLFLSIALLLLDAAEWRKSPEVKGHACQALFDVPYETSPFYTYWLDKQESCDDACDRTRHGTDLPGKRGTET